MLNPVGLVNTGRISTDTAHTFAATKEAAPGIAARFYMNRNFFVNDPDAFNSVSEQFTQFRRELPPLSLSAAEASIALSAVSGGMYEIGDDMLVLGSQPDRLALVENRDLLNMAKLGHASTPVDLLTYEAEDEQPSIFFLRESPRQSILTVFNWTSTARSHTLSLKELGLPADHPFTATNVLHSGEQVVLENGTVRIADQPTQSVRVIKLIDTSVPEAGPKVTAQVPSSSNAGEAFSVSARAEEGSAPAIAYHWDFGDGTGAEGAEASHTYTRAGDFTIRLTASGVDGTSSEQKFIVKVTGVLKAFPDLSKNRRFEAP